MAAVDWSPNRYILPGEVLVHPQEILDLTAGEPVDDDIAAAIPDDVSGGKAVRNLHVAVVAPEGHSEEYSAAEGVRVVPVRPRSGYHTRVLSAGVDYAQVKALLARCQEAHGTTLWRGDGDEEAGTGTDGVEDPPLETILPGLLVIDCESERLVPAGAGCRFAALSYVWGRGGKHGEDDDDKGHFREGLGSRSSSRPLPRTVRDAMHVVRELGLRFLWVDRYCIREDDDGNGNDDNAAPGARHRKHHTIGNMDAVYSRAALTIVAASGAHSDHGLPGSRRIHRRLGTYKLGENGGYSNNNMGGGDGEEDSGGGGGGKGKEAQQHYYLHIDEAHAELSELVWSTRGWTYQEGLLSRHRLVFTETRAVFQCRHYHHRQEQQQQHNDNSVSSSSLGPVARAGDIFYRIEEYTRRRLTYPSDSLRAFLGVLRAFEKLSPPAEHLWGVPFVFDGGGGGDGRRFVARQPAQGLLWKSQSCSLRRISSIPSWSWAGWEGWASQQEQGHPQEDEEEEYQDPRTDHSVWMYGLLPVDPSLADLEDILIEVPCGGGKVLGLAEHFRVQREGRRGRRGGLPAEHAIFVTAWATEVSFSPGRRREYVLDLDTRSDFRLGPGLRDLGGGGETLTVAVICWALSRPAGAARGPRTQSLVLSPSGPGSFCRVGTLETRWRRRQLVEDGRGGAHIAAWDRYFVRRRLRIV